MIGAMLGNRYELIQKVGEGGMAEVYKAKCHLLNRFVAVKILKKQYSNNEEFLNKFKQEASSAASLSHNNIVGMYDIGSENGINYIVMEYVDGKTLKEIINEKKVLNSDEAIIIAMQIAKALQCAHSNNIIHRDVKPHNILVTKDGIIKVADFGIAKATSSVTITNSDRIIGSAHYFSPEQAKGSVVDCKADIYSLGIVMYEMLTGKVPYDAESPVSVALKHIQEQVVPPNQINPDVPENLNNVILKAIEKEPYKRYQTANELFDDLQKIKNDPNTKIFVNNNEDEFTRVMKPISETMVMQKPDYDDSENEYHDSEEDDYDDIEPRKNSKKNLLLNGRKKKFIIGTVGVLALLLIGISAYFYSQHMLSPKKPKNVAVPKIIGIDEDAARKKVEDLGLTFSTTTESSDKPKGVVIKCYPEEGTEIDTDKINEIKAVISSGPRVSSVPNLIDIELEAAKQYLKTYNLQLGRVTYEYSNVEKNRVCDQSPKPQTEIEENTVVDLVISKGSRGNDIKMPNLINKTFDEAIDILERSKLKLGLITKIPTSDEKLDGKVSVQSIEPDTEVRENTVVNLSYYSYGNKDTTSVPNFIGKTVGEARGIAQQVNLGVSVSGRSDFVITSQSVSPGTKIPQGSIIKLNSEPNP